MTHKPEAVERMARLLWQHDIPNEDSFQEARWAYHYDTYHKQAVAVLDAMVPLGCDQQLLDAMVNSYPTEIPPRMIHAAGLRSWSILNGTANLTQKEGDDGED